MFSDEESYNSGHGHAYELYGVDPERGALVVVRPDHCKFVSSPLLFSDSTMAPPFFRRDSSLLTRSVGIDVAKITTLDKANTLEQFFEGFMIPQRS